MKCIESQRHSGAITCMKLFLCFISGCVNEASKSSMQIHVVTAQFGICYHDMYNVYKYIVNANTSEV